MAYSAADIDRAARLLQQALPGLHYDVAKAWVTMEQGTGNNILGVTSPVDHNVRAATPGHPGIRRASNGQYLYTYATLEEGAQGAANLINRSTMYAGIRAALSGGSSRQQALAIVASPWNRSYYRTGLLAGIAGSAANAPALPNTSTGAPTLAAALGRDVSLTSPTQIKALATELKNKGIGGTHTQGDIYAYLIDFIGKKASQVPFNFEGVKAYDPSKNADLGAPSASIPGEGVDFTLGAGDAIQSLANTTIKLVTYIIAVVFIVVGIWLYGKGSGQAQQVAEPVT